MRPRLKLMAAAAGMLTAVAACTTHTPSPTPSSSGPVTGPTSRPSPTPPPRATPGSDPVPRLSVERAPWTLPAPLSRGVVISAKGSGVLAGGLITGDVSSDKVYRVTATRGVGARLPSLVEPIHDAAGTQVGDRMIIVGGGNSSELSAVESTIGNRQPWRIRGQLPSTRSDLSVTTTTRGVLVIGGYDGLSSPREVLRTADGRSFSTFTSLHQGVRYAAVVRAGNSVWVFGGEEQGRELRTTQVIDLAARTVRLGPRLPTPLGHGAVTLVGSRILLMGGRTAPHRVTAKMWWFDPRRGRYSSAGMLPYAVADAGVLDAVDGAYLLGGESPDFTDRVIRVRVMS